MKYLEAICFNEDGFFVLLHLFPITLIHFYLVSVSNIIVLYTHL